MLQVFSAFCFLVDVEKNMCCGTHVCNLSDLQVCECSPLFKNEFHKNKLSEFSLWVTPDYLCFVSPNQSF